MTLLLDYELTPNPFPIQASEKDGVTSEVDLGITVSPQGGATPDLREVQIAIPIGKDDDPYLTASPQLPQPQTDPSTTGWTIDTDGGGTVRIRPASGLHQKLDSSLAFTLPQITVATHVGSVQLTITETYADGGQETDSRTYSLDKQPFAFMLDYFKAVPADLTSLYKRVSLFWDVIADGSVSYRLSAPGWTPPKPSYDNHDGRTGVSTDKLTDTTQFTLQVFSAESGLLGSATCWVTSRLPMFKPGADVTPLLGATGRVLRGSWATENATTVSILMGEQTFDANAPTAAVEHPYLIAVPSPDPTPSLKIAANGVAGTKPDIRSFAGTTAAKIYPFEQAVDLAITPAAAGLRAIVACSAELEIVALPGGEIGQEPLANITNHQPVGVATALVNDTTQVILLLKDGEHFVVLPAWEKDWSTEPPFKQHGQAYGLAVVPDGTVIGVVTSEAQWFLFTEAGQIQKSSRAGVRSSAGYGLAPTKDGYALSLVTMENGDVVFVRSSDCEFSRHEAGSSPGEIAVSADGTFALVGDPAASALTVVDIASRTKTASISLPAAPGRIAISPDGLWAIAALPEKNELAVVDIDHHHCARAQIPVGDSPIGVAITPDSNSILVVIDSALVVL